MQDGLIKVSAVTPKIKVADLAYNEKNILECMNQAFEKQVKICVFPELCITSYSCGDLFIQRALLDGAKEVLDHLLNASKGHDTLFFVGLPYEHRSKLYNVAAIFQDGQVLGFVPKSFLPNYAEFYEPRQFSAGLGINTKTTYAGKEVPFSTKLLLNCANIEKLVVACEICEDVWVPNSPSISHALAGTNVIVNLSASNEIVSKAEYRRNLIKMQSAKLVCAYIYASCGVGESTQDLVYSGHNIIAEDYNILAESERFKESFLTADIDIQKLNCSRRKYTTYLQNEAQDYQIVDFKLVEKKTKLERHYPQNPFIPEEKEELEERLNDITLIQALGLVKRLEYTKCKDVVIGLSGGLDSTLALLVINQAFSIMKLDKKGIHAITMPGFGTASRTKNNAIQLATSLGVSLETIDITKSVTQHLSDIHHDLAKSDVVYENAQARERTQILMDLANEYHGLVIGTGDLSELALGWATYNGDCMSMYNVNASVPKTLVRYLVKHYADNNPSLAPTLLDIVATPISPELLPLKEGKVVQETENIIGPYELHDFFLYYVFKNGFKPEKIYRIAKITWGSKYDDATILKWLKVFYTRFFSQQYKRSCMPDGPKVGTISLSPRGDLRMPSDAEATLWLTALAKIKC
ncbi:MAG: NAD(+) synthase [Bacilli bacterium]|nr:NAD(+) synthase [Bacilli bacterium]